MEDTSASTIYSVVIDNGSSFMKVGICNDDPQIITIPTIIGTNRVARMLNPRTYKKWRP